MARDPDRAADALNGVVRLKENKKHCVPNTKSSILHHDWTKEARWGGRSWAEHCSRVLDWATDGPSLEAVIAISTRNRDSGHSLCRKCDWCRGREARMRGACVGLGIVMDCGGKRPVVGGPKWLSRR